MTIKEAIELLEQATSQVNANRVVHIKILQAIELIKKELLKKEDT